MSSISISERLIKRWGNDFTTCLFQVRVMGSWSPSSSSGHQAGPLWTGCPSTTEPLTPTATQTGTKQTSQVTSHAHLWEVGGNWRPLEETHADLGKCANSADSGPSRDQFFSLDSAIEKWCWITRFKGPLYFSKTCTLTEFHGAAWTVTMGHDSKQY